MSEERRIEADIQDVNASVVDKVPDDGIDGDGAVDDADADAAGAGAGAAGAAAAAAVSDEEVHPLENHWTLWFYQTPARPGDNDDWENNLREVGSFDTIERFWAYYRNTMWPSSINFRASYHLFKKGIRPAWEDPANQNGGKWVLYIKHDRASLDVYWENIVLALVGESIDEDDDITGAVISRRRAADRIAVWNRDKDNKNAIMALGRRIKAAVVDEVNSPPKFTMEYSFHHDSLRSQKSYASPQRYTL